MVCEGVTSRLEVTHELIRLLGLQNEVIVNEVSSEYWKKVYFADRPVSERLVNSKLSIRGVNIMRDWRVCLREYISEHYKGYLES